MYLFDWTKLQVYVLSHEIRNFLLEITVLFIPLEDYVGASIFYLMFHFWNVLTGVYVSGFKSFGRC